jgi:hypothetical protein
MITDATEIAKAIRDFAESRDTSPLDIQKALSDWRTINADPRKWATFEAVQFGHERVVRVTWGVIHSNGYKECAIQTITFFLGISGDVHEYSHTHF